MNDRVGLGRISACSGPWLGEGLLLYVSARPTWWLHPRHLRQGNTESTCEVLAGQRRAMESWPRGWHHDRDAAAALIGAEIEVDRARSARDCQDQDERRAPPVNFSGLTPGHARKDP